MLKLLTMEMAQVWMRTIAMMQYDKRNCFDRIFRQNSNIFAQKSKNLQEYPNSKDNRKRQYEMTSKDGTWNNRWDIPTSRRRPNIGR
jgi:hypothetical protein